MVSKDKISYFSISMGNAEAFKGLIPYEELCRISAAEVYGIGMKAEGIPVGTACFFVDENAEAVIDWFFIHPDQRKKGYGSELMNYIKKIVCDSDIEGLNLYVAEEDCTFEVDEFIDAKCSPEASETRRVFRHTLGELRNNDILGKIKTPEYVQDFSCVTRAMLTRLANHLNQSSYEINILQKLREQGQIDENISSIYLDQNGDAKAVFIVQNFNNEFIRPYVLRNIDPENPLINIQLIAQSFRATQKRCNDSAVITIICRKPETELLLGKLFPESGCTDIYHIKLKIK